MHYVYKHKSVIFIILVILAIYSCLHFYLIFLLNESQTDHIDTTIEGILVDIVDLNDEVFKNIDHELSVQRNIIIKNKNNISQSYFDDFSLVELDPFGDVIENYRYSPIVYNDEYDEHNKFMQENIYPGYELHPTGNVITSYFINKVPFYIPIAYSNPSDFFEKETYGLDLYNLTSTKNHFFDLIMATADKLVGSGIPFAASVDEYDTGMYIGLLSTSGTCDTYQEDSFANLINKNNNSRCILGINYIAVLIKSFYSDIISRIASDNIRESLNIAFIVVNSETNTILYKPPHLNSNIKKLTDNYLRFEVLKDIVRFKNTTGGQKIDLYLLFDETVLDDNIENQKLIVHIITPISFLIAIVCALVIYYFITKKIQAEEDKYLQIRNIINYVNHELRNPLHMISGFSMIVNKKLENIIKRTDDVSSKYLSEIKSNVGTIINSAKFASVIVGDVLDMQKLEDNRVKLDKKKCNCKQIINASYKAIKYKLAECPLISFEKNDIDLIIYTDPNRLVQILVNFLTNSLKFTETGTIKLSVELVNNSVMFSVSDTGPGIEQHIYNDLFEKSFVSIHTGKYTGTGIGLYLSGMLAHLLGFTLKCSTALQIGSTFYIICPIDVLKIPDDIENTEDDDFLNSDSDDSDDDSNIINYKILKNELGVQYTKIKKFDNVDDVVDSVDDANDANDANDIVDDIQNSKIDQLDNTNTDQTISADCGNNICDIV